MQMSPPVPPIPTDSASPPVPPASVALPTSPRLVPARDTPVTLKLLPLESEANAKGRGVIIGEPPLKAIDCERSRSPERTVHTLDATPPSKLHGKRRSMSVGEVDLKKAANATLTTLPVPMGPREKRSEDSVGWDSTIRGIFSDFGKEPSQLDQDAALGLRVPPSPLTPRLRMRSAEQTTSAAAQPDIRQMASSPPLGVKPNPTIVAHAPDTDGVSVRESTETPETSASSRSPPLFTGTSTRAFSYSQRPFPSAASRPLGPRSASSTHTPSGSRDRLLVHPRPVAFNSEPSLVPTNGSAISSPLSTFSQHDLSTSPGQQLRRYPSDSLGPTDSEVVETRGKECARRAWEEDEAFMTKERIAEWLGGL
jgi:PH/SEC7 domain-containing protein